MFHIILLNLSKEELHELFITESNHFIESFNNGGSTDQLKKLRRQLQQITDELKKRRESNGHGNGNGNGNGSSY